MPGASCRCRFIFGGEIIVLNQKNIFLFTYTYPYGDGEQFIETELVHLKRQFGHVILVPSKIEGSRRPMPTPVEVDLSLAKNGLKAGVLAKSAALSLSSRVLLEEISQRPVSVMHRKSFIAICSYLYWAIKSRDWVLSYISDNDIDINDSIFYTYWLGEVTMGLVLAKGKNSQIKVVSRVHGADLYEERHIPQYLPFRTFIFKNIDNIFTISENGRSYLRARFNGLSDKFILSRLGVDDPSDEASPSEDGKFRILSCSFISPVKRLGLLIEGIREFGERHPDTSVEWQHIGDGPGRSSLEEAASRLPQSIEYGFLGTLAHQDVVDYYRTHPIDVFINVSEMEGLPVSIMEAQSFGVPVIATAVGGTPEIVTEDNGILLPSNPSPDDISRALESFTSDRTLMMAKRKQSRLNWRLNYDSKSNYVKFCKYLQEILAK